MFRFFIILYLAFIKQSIGEEVLFENFTNNPQEKWEFISDQVMGGISDGKVEYFKEDFVLSRVKPRSVTLFSGKPAKFICAPPFFSRNTRFLSRQIET